MAACLSVNPTCKHRAPALAALLRTRNKLLAARASMRRYMRHCKTLCSAMPLTPTIAMRLMMHFGHSHGATKKAEIHPNKEDTLQERRFALGRYWGLLGHQ